MTLQQAEEAAAYDRWVVQDGSLVTISGAGSTVDTIETLVSAYNQRVDEMLETGELAAEQARYPEVMRFCGRGEQALANLRRIHHAIDHVLGQIATVAEQLAGSDQAARMIAESAKAPGGRPEIAYVADDEGARRPAVEPADPALRFLVQDVVALSATLRQVADDYHEALQRPWMLLDDEEPEIDPDFDEET